MAITKDFSAHLRVVMALIVREMSTRFGNKVGGYAWAVLDPAGHVVLLTLVFSAITHVPALGTNFPLFFASGYVAMQFYQSMESQIHAAINANRPLLAYPVVAPVDVITARFCLQFMTNCLIAVIVIGGCILWAGHEAIIQPLTMVAADAWASVIGLGFGMMNIVLFQKSSLYEKAFGILSRPLFIVSGVFFIPEGIPLPYRDYILWNPIAHIIMWFRTGIYPFYDAIYLDWQFVFITAMVLMLMGTLLITMASRTLRGR